jgi:RHS repeat-associated protein
VPAIAWEYVWFGGQPVAQIAGATGAIEWTFTDHLGTPLLQTDAAAQITWRAEYEPYGTIHTLRAGTGKHQPLRFPGQEAEEGGEVAYNIFRWYRAGWGRYHQADPLWWAALSKPYAYASANPTRWADPVGLLQYGSAIVKNPWSKECGLMTPWVDAQGDCDPVGDCWKPSFTVEAKYTVSFDDKDSYDHEVKHVAVMDAFVFAQALAKLKPAEQMRFKKYTDCRSYAIGVKDAFLAAINELPLEEKKKHWKIDADDPCLWLW